MPVLAVRGEQYSMKAASGMLSFNRICVPVDSTPLRFSTAVSIFIFTSLFSSKAKELFFFVFPSPASQPPQSFNALRYAIQFASAIRCTTVVALTVGKPPVWIFSFFLLARQLSFSLIMNSFFFKYILQFHLFLLAREKCGDGQASYFGGENCHSCRTDCLFLRALVSRHFSLLDKSTCPRLRGKAAG